tara:strand:+ start:254 stop:898 length:645 start_codon:yes stop_codon:yes gene_type:complete
MWDNPLLRRPAWLSVWLYLLTHAYHGMMRSGESFRCATEREYPTVLFRGQRVHLQPGQLTSGAYQIAAVTGVPRGTVERITKTFKREGMIEELTSPRCSLITVKNWHQYQSREELIEERIRSKRGTSEDLYKNEKKKKNDKTVDETKILRNAILKHLATQEIGNPEAYLGKIQQECPESAIRKAWNDWKRGMGIESPGQFFCRCKEYAKQSQKT